jgi:uncharacterized protein (DUF58 family)
VAVASSRLRQLANRRQAGNLVAQVAERLSLTVTGLSVIGVAVAGWFLARLIGSRTMYLIVYAGVIGMVMAWAVSRRRLALEVERSRLPSRMRVGQTADVDLRIDTRKRVSTILVHEELPEGLGRPVEIPIGALSPHAGFEHRYSFKPTRRGVYRVGPCTATWSDPFGLTTHSQVLAPATEVIVHPSTELVHDRVLTRMWEDPPLRPPVSKPWPTGFEFYGMRDYVVGDDLRRVVWNAVAKTGKMLIRESEQGITDRVMVVLDTDREWHAAGEPSATFEAGVRVAASIGVRHLEDGFSVTLVTDEVRLRALRGPRARLSYLDELARVGFTTTTLADVAAKLVNEAKGGIHLVVITPHLDRAAAGRLRLLVQRGVSLVVAKLMWEESDPMSLQRAAAIGGRLVQVPPSGPLEAVFAHQVGVGMR